LPQALLPLIPDGASPLSDLISVQRGNGQWTYYCGFVPVFQHAEDDRRSFRMITSQLVCQGACRQMDIVRMFGVSANSVKRSVKKYREGGAPAFYQPRKVRSAPVMTTQVTLQAQQLLDRGCCRSEVAAQTGVKYDTLRKALNQGRLRELPQTSRAVARPEASDKSERGVADAAAELGIACTRPDERVMAAVGLLQGAPTRFEACRDVTFGGVLCGLPALAGNGLFEHLQTVFPSLGGYYTTTQVVILLAYMALCRIQTVEQLQYESPGELGKVLGLDRVPEVRCLRKKLSELSQANAPETWAGLLSHQWLQADPELAGKLYVDGHVRLYHGKLTKLPRRYVSRDKLCLRGTTDYWVNDALGRPFFVVERPIDQGLLEAISNDIVPRLLQDVPGQPSAEELEKDPHLCRFTLIFDREGYQPRFFKEMWKTHRIACITYHKFPKDDWAIEEFSEVQITLPTGEQVSLPTAERGSRIGNKDDGWVWVRETRKLTTSGQQISLISTAYSHWAREDAAALFSRWSQENFFRYMMEHYALDLLSEYGVEPIPGTNKPVVNPAWRELDYRCRSLKGQLQTKQAAFTAHTLGAVVDSAQMAQWEKRKTELAEEVQGLAHQLEEVKLKRKQTPHRIAWEKLPEEHKCQRLAPSRKRLLDTVRLIAYRAETAMTQIIREQLSREDDARSIVRDLMRSEADILPNIPEKLLNVQIHPFANPRTNRAIQHLLKNLNEAEFTYPCTDLKLVYTLIGAQEN
jgi:transposase